ncbi:uncharacterized protein LOC116932927 [Daphnia magna]|uniref:uncharacterized protein LOC116932927 n=1 Tax=Daphnia magna TaxID=35525 RepID=UPI001E1BA28E|nr:uncharacterized protein LOC116932927 [Daphnia magna]
MMMPIGSQMWTMRMKKENETNIWRKKENDATIAATDQYEKVRPRSSERYSRSRDSRVRFADNHNIRESSREKSLSRNRDNSPYRRDYNSSARRNYNPSGHRQSISRFPSDQRPNIGTNTPTGKETTTDQTLTTTDIKRVKTATNSYSNNITLETILEPLKIEK